MKLIIDVDEKLVCEGFERNFTEEERNILIRAIGNGVPYEEKEEPFITEARNASIEQNLPLYFVYYEEKGIFEVYETETKELFEKRRCAKHLSNYVFKHVVNLYLDNYSDWKG